MTDKLDQSRNGSEEEDPDPLSMDDDELAADLFGEELHDQFKKLAREVRPDDGE